MNVINLESGRVQLFFFLSLKKSCIILNLIIYVVENCKMVRFKKMYCTKLEIRTTSYITRVFRRKLINRLAKAEIKYHFMKFTVNSL